MLVHQANLIQKENHKTKYGDAYSQSLLKEIRVEYNRWHQANLDLVGPVSSHHENDNELIAQRVQLLNQYKDFIDQQKYAEQFDSRSNLHSSVLEEFLYYLFRDLVADFGTSALIGKSHTFKDIFFVPPNYAEMVAAPYAHIEVKDHDFVIGSRIKSELACEGSAIIQSQAFDIPAVAIECKTYLDKTMLEGAASAASQLKARNPNSIYIVVMEWIKLSDDVNIHKYASLDQLYVLRKQKNTDREFRYLGDYVKNPIYGDVVWHLYEKVRKHLTTDWEAGVEFGLQRGWLI